MESSYPVGSFDTVPQITTDLHSLICSRASTDAGTDCGVHFLKGNRYRYYLANTKNGIFRRAKNMFDSNIFSSCLIS